MTRMISPMGQTFKTPGAYLWTQPEERPSLHRVRTDIAGFVGYVERVPVPPPDEAAMPYRVTSYEEFVSQFGGFIRSAYLAYAVRGFFENGGTTCWVMPVTANTATRNAQASSAPRQAVLDLPGWELDQLRLDKSSFLGTHYDKTIELAFEGTNAVAAVQAGDLLKITAKGRTAFAKVGGFPKDKNVLYLDRPVHGPLDQSAVILPLRPALQVTARSAGSWGNRLRLNLTPLGSGDTLGEFALRVTLLPGDDPTQSREEEFYNRLTLGPGIFNACDRINAYSNVIQVAVPQ